MKKNNVFHYLAGACFILAAALSLFDYHYFSIRSLAGLVLTAVGLFIGKNMLAAIGSGIYAVASAWDYIWAFINFGYAEFVAPIVLISDFLGILLFGVFLFLACTNQKVKTFGTIAAITKVLALLLALISSALRLLHIDFFSFILSAFLIAGTLLLSAARNYVPKAVPANVNAGSQIQRLEKLKTLLDNGVISQEEFDEKKKQVLNL